MRQSALNPPKCVNVRNSRVCPCWFESRAVDAGGRPWVPFSRGGLSCAALPMSAPACLPAPQFSAA